MSTELLPADEIHLPQLDTVKRAETDGDWGNDGEEEDQKMMDAVVFITKTTIQMVR